MSTLGCVKLLYPFRDLFVLTLREPGTIRKPPPRTWRLILTIQQLSEEKRKNVHQTQQ